MRALRLVLSLLVAWLALACSKPEPPTAVALYPPYNVTQTSAVLTWSLNADEDFSSYALYRAQGPGVFDGGESIVVFNSPIVGSFEDDGLAAETTYYYAVQVNDTEGLTTWSNEVELTTLAQAPPKPPTAVFLNPASELTPTSLTLTWSPNTDADFERYTVYRSDAPGIDQSTGTVVDTFLDAAFTTTADDGLTPEATYYYRVLVSDTEGLSTFSNEIAATLPEAQTPVPPTAVSLYPPIRETHQSVLLAWSRNGDPDFARYLLLRGTQAGVTTQNAVTVATLTDVAEVAFDDTGLTPETTYYYRVQVEDDDGLSALSNEVEAVTLAAPVAAPPAPVTLSPATGLTQTTLELNWTVSTEADFLRYVVLRGDAPGVDQGNGTVVSTSTDRLAVSFTDTGLSPATAYAYRVVVEDTESLSSLSNEISATTTTPVAPQPPTAVSLFPAYGQTTTSLALTWTVNTDDDFARYSLLRDTQPIPDANAGQSVFTVTDRSQVLFQDTGLSPDTAYHYRVVVANSAGMTALSNEVIGTTLSVASPAKPTPVLLGPVFDVDADAMSLSWTRNGDPDFDRYELYRADGPGVSTADTLVATIGSAGQTSFRDTGLTVYTEYFYRVWVYNSAGESIESNEVSDTTSYDAPPAPILLQDPTDITGTSMTLGWTRSSSLDFGSYRLYRATGPVVDPTAVLVYETPDPNSLFFIDTGLSPNTRYYYKVYVVDEWDLSTGSNTVSDTTLNTEAPSCQISRSSAWQQVGVTLSVSAVGCVDNLTSEADLTVSWRFGDGTGWSAPTTTKDTTHAYSARGAYVIELEVSDGTYSGFAEVPVVIDEVVQLPASTFLMGRTAGTTPWSFMEPERVIYVDGFYIDTYEVSVAAYAAFLSDGNGDHYWVSQRLSDNLDGTYTPWVGHEDRPAGAVSWHDAAAFCAWAGKRLPTEAEWEYAARGPATGPNYWYPWGDGLPQSISPTPANYASLVGDTVDVTSYPGGATAWDGTKAIYNLAGNADEWVYDYYDPDYYAWANANGDNNNPLGPAASPFPPNEPDYRVSRGGSWVNDENPLRVSFRTYHDPYQRGAMGIRCVTRTLP